MTDEMRNFIEATNELEALLLQDKPLIEEEKKPFFKFMAKKKNIPSQREDFSFDKIYNAFRKVLHGEGSSLDVVIEQLQGLSSFTGGKRYLAIKVPRLRQEIEESNDSEGRSVLTNIEAFDELHLTYIAGTHPVDKDSLEFDYIRQVDRMIEKYFVFILEEVRLLCKEAMAGD